MSGGDGMGTHSNPACYAGLSYFYAFGVQIQSKPSGFVNRSTKLVNTWGAVNMNRRYFLSSAIAAGTVAAFSPLSVLSAAFGQDGNHGKTKVFKFDGDDRPEFRASFPAAGRGCPGAKHNQPL